MTATPVKLIGVLVLGIATLSSPPDRADEDRDSVATLLTPLLGRPAIIEIATLDDLGKTLQQPAGWGYAQADSSNVQALQRHFDLKQPPALLFLDRFGNLLHRDESSQGRRRIGGSVSDFSKKRKDITSRLIKHEKDARIARAKGKEAAEVENILASIALSVRGYPQAEAARERLRELESDRRRRLLETLAGEGITPRKSIESELKDLWLISRGLSAGQIIERQRKRFRRGVVVVERRRRG